MPYGKRKYYRKRRKNATYRKGAMVQRKRSIYRPIGKTRKFGTKWSKAILRTKYITFNYTDTGFSGSLAGGFYIHKFRLNSLYDPDFTGAGVQPYGYDQWMPGLFNIYNALASKITIYYYTDDPVKKMLVYLIPQRIETLGYTDASDLNMANNSRKKVYNSEVSTTKTCKISHYYSNKKLYSELSPRDLGFQSAYNTNPVNVAFWGVYFILESAEADVNVKFDVKIKYYAILSMSTDIDES